MKDDFSIKGEVIAVLEAIEDPTQGKNLLDAHMIEQVDVQSGVVDITVLVELGRTREERFSLEDSIYNKVEEIAGVNEVKVKLTTPKAVAQQKNADPLPEPKQPAAAKPKAAAIPQAEPIQGVGKVIAVASGKGGVGKSTVAVNLALGLRDLGYRVGVLDIDIYGPSLPTLLGLMSRPSVSERQIVPLQTQGLRIMSLGFLMEDDTPVIWRGPIVTGIIRQFLRDVDWSGLDYLIIDMPPGTGDAQLALAQTVPVDGAVIVTTPSKLALIDAARGLEMFRTLNIDVLGIVENMSEFVTPTGEVFKIFGDGGVEEEAKRLDTTVLASIPLDPAVRSGGDEGSPVVASAPDSPAAKSFLALAENVAKQRPIQPGEESADGKKKGLFSFLKS
ncbi:Mrp/NBP35 family ATP-binding protein [Bradymonas sediminis]|uniref:Iron-sulfur cluster carrier protein n=1 Tax=Bradymonas sediminis TaxID=1548548 RepID=A0A2Z4FNA7_9DELT|nr:Mrp/NBP35 family ATP-binding protein [Bradymonas sediminis]AWV90459.1 sodium:proton antiporter [Bradymonas sediminis]TDP72155.1 ATP-binding protein involved in chromosome partitioning [Bradymonas sediminis]